MISREDLCRAICRKARITREQHTPELTKDELLKINAYMDVQIQELAEIRRRNRDLEALLHRTTTA